MAQASPSVRAQVASLATDQIEGRLDWGDFLQALPDGIGDDERIHELIELLQDVPPTGLVSDQAYADYKQVILEKITALSSERAI